MPEATPVLVGGAGPVSGAGRLSFAARLAAVAAVGFAGRVVYAAVEFGDKGPQADGLYYTAQAEMIAEGNWFEHPFQLAMEAADHPPLNALLLSLPARFDRGNFMAMRILLCVVGAITIMLVGVVARLVTRGPGSRYAERVGLVAAALAAVYANFWMNDAILMAEAVTAACVGGVLVAAYRLIERPSSRRAAIVGALVGLAALARAELALLLVLIAVPAVFVGTRDWRARLGRTAACGAAAVAVAAPWCVYNLARFDRTVLLSTGEGHVVSGANCPSTYYGPTTGFWSFECAFQLPGAPIDVDQSELSAWYGEQGAAYRSDHLDRLPAVMAARIGRAWSIWWVGQMAETNTFEGRPKWASLTGVATFWALVPLAVGGAVVARRRRLVIWPLLTLPVLVTGVAAWYYGIVRFRLPAEFTVVVLAAVALSALWERRTAAVRPREADSAAGVERWRTARASSGRSHP